MSEKCNENYNKPTVKAPNTDEQWSKLVTDMIDRQLTKKLIF